MSIVRRGRKGFTLIELLIVVGVLGILAAVIIPNVGRFLGSGEEEARDTEFQNVITAVAAMMIDNKITSIPILSNSSADCDTGSNELGSWPDNKSSDSKPAGNPGKVNDPTGGAYFFPFDGDGYVLFGHDITADVSTVPTVNYMTVSKSTFCYSALADGTITQYLKDGTQINP